MRASRAISRSAIVAPVEKFINQSLPLIQAKTARSALAQVDAGRPYEQFVDGVPGAPLESVKPGGKILFKFGNLSRVVDWIYEQLVQRSPIGPNQPPHLHYFEDHELYIDGTRAIAGLGEVINIPPGAEVMIVNGRPYARKIEHGLSVQAPSGVYEVTALAAQRLFPEASITFDYVAAGVESAVTARTGVRHIRSLRHGGNRASYRYPAITIRSR